MMFDGTFGRLDKHELAALVSCLVPVDRSNVSGGLLLLLLLHALPLLGGAAAGVRAPLTAGGFQ